MTTILNREGDVWTLRTLSNEAYPGIYQLEVSIEGGGEYFRLYELTMKGGQVIKKTELVDMLAITNYHIQKALDPNTIYVRHVLVTKWMDIRNKCDIIYGWE